MRLRCRLRELRGKKSLGDIAAETGFNRGMLSMFELGRQLPKDEQIPALEQAYGQPFEVWYSARTLAVIEEDEAA